jgi:Flp pilus assembly protein CpaB
MIEGAATRPGRRGPRIVLAALLGLAAAGGVFLYVSSVQQANQAAVQQAAARAAATAKSNVVVAKDNIPAQTPLDPSKFEVHQVSTDGVAPNAISSLSDLQGKVLAAPVAAGEQIVSYRLENPAQPQTQKFGDTVPPGKRAMSVTFTELAGSGGLIAPGDFVDVIAVFNKDTMGKDQSMVLLQDVQVLAVAQATSIDQLPRAQPPASTAGQVAGGANAPVPTTSRSANPLVPITSATPTVGVPVAPAQARTLTLAVDPEAAERLALAEDFGHLRYVIRPGSERNQSSTMPADLSTLANPLQQAAGQITAVEISPTNVKVGDVIDVKITVKNTSNSPLQTQNPQPDYTYVQGQTYFSQQFASEPGKWRVAVGTGGLDSTDLPYRWGFGGDLAPGASTTVTGHIKVTSDFKPTNFWASLVQEPTSVAQSGVGITLVTALPQNLAIIAVDVANVRSGPSIASAVIDKVQYGTQLQIVGQSADWFKIKLPDQREGWVAAGWIVTAAQ